jgi:hypothetical protein
MHILDICSNLYSQIAKRRRREDPGNRLSRNWTTAMLEMLGT